MAFQGELISLSRDLIETDGWPREVVAATIQSKVDKMRGIVATYGDGGRLRGGRDYLIRLYNGDRSDHFDDLIIDRLERGDPWGMILVSLISSEFLVRKSESGSA